MKNITLSLLLIVMLLPGCRIARTSISPPSITTNRQVIYDRFQVTLRTHEAMVTGINSIAQKISTQETPITPEQLQVLQTLLESSRGMLENLANMNNMVILAEQNRRENLSQSLMGVINLIVSTIAAARR